MSTARVAVEGLDKVMANLNKHISKKKEATLGGLLAAGLIIQAEAQRRTPVLTGNLKGSAYTRVAPDNPKAVEVGFGAAYAIYVHENMESYHSNGEAKFLENAAREKQDEVMATIAAHGRKG